MNAPIRTTPRKPAPDQYFITYDDRQTGWHTMEGPAHEDAKAVAEEVAETLDQFGRFGHQRPSGISSIRIMFVSEAPDDVTREIAEAVLTLRPHLSVMDALRPYEMEAAQ